MSKRIVKIGIDRLDKPMTKKEAENHGDRNMPSDLKKAGFVTTVFESCMEIHGGLWYRISYCKAY